MSRHVMLRSGAARATVALRGAEALAWSAGGRNLLWTPDAALWSDVSPLLFPVVGWTRHGQARVGGRLYPLALHGFARLLDYEVTARGDDFIRLVLRDDALTRSIYPFPFSLTAEYRLSGAALEMSLTIANRGGGPMPYACGFHPGFRWPFAGGAQEDYRIVFETPETGLVPHVAPGGLIARTSRKIAMDGSTLLLSPELFSNDALCFLNAASKSLRFEGPQAAIAMTTEDLPHIALWMRPGGQYLCLEPWSGHSDPKGFEGDLFDKPSMRRLEAGASARHWARFEAVT
jgi:galactose mutarotase-like enzyme